MTIPILWGKTGLCCHLVVTSHTSINLVLNEVCDFLQILQQLLLPHRRIPHAGLQCRRSAVTLQRRPKHLLILEQCGPVEVQLRVESSSSVHLFL